MKNIILLIFFCLGVGYLLGKEHMKKQSLRPVKIIKIYQTKKSQQKRTSTPIKEELVKLILNKEEPKKQNKKLSELDANELRHKIVVQFDNLKNLSKKEIQNNIKLADALIAKDPNSYKAYKSKLISLLIDEIKFTEKVELETYEDLYDELLSFDGPNLEDELLAEELLKSDALKSKNPTELIGIDKDLLHIPFLRLSALKDYDELIAVSEEYIEDYPNSYLGHMYLAEGLWRQGEEELAIKALKEGLNEGASNEAAMLLFHQIQKDPLKRIYSLSID